MSWTRISGGILGPYLDLSCLTGIHFDARGVTQLSEQPINEVFLIHTRASLVDAVRRYSCAQ